MHLWLQALARFSDKAIEDATKVAEHTDNTSDTFWDKVLTMVTTYGGKIVLAIVVLIVGTIVIKALCKGVKKALRKTKLDESVRGIFYKLIKFLLKKYPNITYAAIFGFVVGSIGCVFPGFKNIDLIGVIAMIAGIVVLWACDRLAPENAKE